MVAETPSSAMLSTRDKPDLAYCRDMFGVMQAHDVRYFFYVGGNDSADTVRIVNEEAERAGYDMRAIHIPKTIDNDLAENDHTPGYGSAARFVACAFMGANLDNRSLPGTYIGVVMGRNAGFLTAASVVARKYPDDGPHLIYLPERPFDVGRFVRDVNAKMKEFGRCVVAISEGVKDEAGVEIVTKLTGDSTTDPHGHRQLSGTGALGDLLANEIKKSGVKRVRADTLGYLQRSFMGVVSDVDAREAREVGEKAAQFAIWHDLDGSITIRRTGNYSVDYELVPLERVAALTRVMPDEFISPEGNDVTDEFFLYVRPLLGRGMPEPARIRAPKVARIVKK
jgi:6-phosphofructokinase 1